MELIIYLLIGAIAGFACRLFGVGGGLIIVPILYVVFTQMDYDPSRDYAHGCRYVFGHNYCDLYEFGVWHIIKRVPCFGR